MVCLFGVLINRRHKKAIRVAMVTVDATNVLSYNVSSHGKMVLTTDNADNYSYIIERVDLLAQTCRQLY